MASDLVFDGITDAFEMSPRQIVWFSHRASRRRREELKALSISGRVAQAEGKDFEKFLKEIS